MPEEQTLQDVILQMRLEEQKATAAINAEMLEENPAEETFWQSLSEEDRLKAFCCVIRRICKGELESSNTYRSMLYKIFGFSPQAYSAAYHAGYMRLHNILFEYKEREYLI